MRYIVLFCVVACARALPPESDTTTIGQTIGAERVPPDPAASPPQPRIVAPALSARELVEQAGVATFLEDRQLEVAALDMPAMERWFTRPPHRVFFYAERLVEVAELGVTVRGRCQQVRRWDSVVINELSVVVWRQGGHRTVVQLGQEKVVVADQALERGEWDTVGARTLPMQVVAWDETHIRYAEGAALHEVACVPALRTVSCGEHFLGPRGYCVDRRLVVRPWRAPTVPHVGSVIPAYNPPVPDVPEGDCEVTCEPSSCEEALQMRLIPRAPLYAEESPVLAAFRTRAACRAFASAREEGVEAGSDDGVW